jgi:hypothetical protein
MSPPEINPTSNPMSATSVRPVPSRRLWWLGAGFGVWCSALVFLYAVQAVGCVFDWPTGSLRVTLVVVFLAHVVAVGWMWRNAARAAPDTALSPTGSFLHAAIAWTVIAAFVATVLTFGPPLFLSTCI